MNKPTALFAVSETGAAAWAAPLWRRWNAGEAPCDFRIVYADNLDGWFKRNGFDGASNLIAEPRDAQELERSLDGFTPAAVITSAANRPLDDVVWSYCQSKSMPCAAIIDTWYGYRKRLTGPDHVLRTPQAVLVIDERACEDAVEEGLDRASLNIIGHPAWEQAPALPEADPASVAFISQPIQTYYDRTLGYTEITALERLIAFAQAHPDMIADIQVCPHPEERADRLPVRPPARIATSGPDAILSCGTVIGMFSSLLTDTCLGGRKTISWQPDAVDTTRSSLARFGYIPLATNEDELLAALQTPRSETTALADMLAGSTERLESFTLEFAA